MPGKKPPEPKKNATRTLTNKEIDKYITGIYDGTYGPDNLPENVYLSIVEYLKQGLYEGFGSTYNDLLKKYATEGGAYGTDLELLEELRENVYMFGAAKTYAMTKDISSLLLDEDGKLRTNNEFNDIAREKYDNWNNNWGETEYSTAIGQGYVAEKWNNIEEQKDILPNLMYSAIGDACEICMPLDGTTAPVDDPIWSKIAPLNHFNCKCLLLQKDGDALLTPQDEKDETYDNAMKKMDDTFKGNPGKDGMVFTKDHPYFEEARADKVGKNNFGLPIPEKD